LKPNLGLGALTHRTVTIAQNVGSSCRLPPSWHQQAANPRWGGRRHRGCIRECASDGLRPCKSSLRISYSNQPLPVSQVSPSDFPFPRLYRVTHTMLGRVNVASRGVVTFPLQVQKYQHVLISRSKCGFHRHARHTQP
jgi:hypothetical protein